MNVKIGDAISYHKVLSSDYKSDLVFAILVQIFTDAGQYVIRFGSSDSGVEPAAEVIQHTNHLFMFHNE